MCSSYAELRISYNPMFGNFGYSYDSEFRGDRRTTLAEARDTPHATAPVVFVDMHDL